MNKTQRIYCPPSLPVTGFTLTLTDAHMLRDSLARTLKDFEHALAEWPKDVEANRADFERAAVSLRTRIAELEKAISLSKRRYALEQRA